MKAIVARQYGPIDELQLEEITKPSYASHEVLVRIRYAGINPVDWKIKEGLLKEKFACELPFIPGWDCAGVIEEVGEKVTRFKKGDEIYTYCRKGIVHNGTYAEYIALEENFIALKPKNISFAEAAAIPLVALTAWQSLFGPAKIQKGNTILIHAGAGGVGSFAIQFAKWKGAKIYTTASSGNHPYVKSLGADVCIDYTQQDFVKALLEKEPEGVDIVYDCVGGKTLRASFPTVKKGGIVVSIVNTNVEELAKAFPIRTGYILVTPNHEELTQITALIEKNIIKPVPIEEFELKNAPAALKQIKEGHTKGKLVLRVP